MQQPTAKIPQTRVVCVYANVFNYLVYILCLFDSRVENEIGPPDYGGKNTSFRVRFAKKEGRNVMLTG